MQQQEAHTLLLHLLTGTEPGLFCLAMSSVGLGMPGTKLHPEDQIGSSDLPGRCIGSPEEGEMSQMGS